MKLPKLLPPATLLGMVSLSLASVSSGQTVARNTRTIKPGTGTTVTTNDTGTSSSSAATDPVGFTSTSLLANSDSRISIPFTRPTAFSGTISSINGNTITVAASPGWTANQYAYAVTTQPNTYYAIIGPNFSPVTGTVSATNGSTAVTGSGSAFTQMVAGDEIIINGTAATVASVTSATSLTLVSPFIGTTASGAAATLDHSPKEGSYYTVTANGTNSLTVNLNGDSLSAIAGSLGNTTVTLIPYWTLGTAFPATDSGVSFSPSASSKSIGTQILMPDLVTVGINLSAASVYYFFNGNWRSAAGSSTDSADDTVLPPSTYFTVRNAATATTFTPTGAVYMNRLSVPLDTSASGQQDNAVAVNRPASVTLNDLGLIVSGAFTPSTSTKAITDQLFVYDNTAPGINKSASAVYYYYAGAWRSAADTTGADFGSTPVAYGTGYTVRKAKTSDGATSFWQNTRNY